MRATLRRLRGVVGIALTWGLIWAVVGIALGLVARMIDPATIDPGEDPLSIGRILGQAGFISGFVFALILAVTERYKRIGDLSLLRVGTWGALGGAVIPLLTQVDASNLIFTCPLGVILSTGSVVIARRAELRAVEDGALLTAGSPER